VSVSIQDVGICIYDQTHTVHHICFCTHAPIHANFPSFAHTGLEIEERRLVEDAFRKGQLRVLCATATLAMGVNLPAHLVVIKGTKAWRGNPGGYQNLDHSSLLQMIGRAGRPGFDDSGTSIIMTDERSKSLYVKLTSSGLTSAKSRLSSRLNEVMNTEISQRHIVSLESAMNWMRSTLLFVQQREMMSSDSPKRWNKDKCDDSLRDICVQAIDQLKSINAVVESSDGMLYPKITSHIMSQHLVSFAAMEQIVRLPYNANQCQILRALSSMEGTHRPVRRSEKRVLNEIHKQIKYKLDGPPSKVRVQQPYEKAFVLIQGSISQVTLQDYAMKQELATVVDFAYRTLQAIEDYGANGCRSGMLAIAAIKLRRSLAMNLWGSGDGVLKQFQNLDATTLAGLRMHGVSSFEDVMSTPEQDLEKATNRKAPFGLNLRNAVAKVLQSRLKVSAGFDAAASTVTCKIEPYSTDDVQVSAPGHEFGSSSTLTYTMIALIDAPGGCLCYRKNISKAESFTFGCPSATTTISIHLIASMIGLDCK
jgi:ATP-dependent DNA helicase HFM1/MER3